MLEIQNLYRTNQKLYLVGRRIQVNSDTEHLEHYSKYNYFIWTVGWFTFMRLDGCRKATIDCR